MNYIFGENQFLDTEFTVLTDDEEKLMQDEGIPESLGILPLKNTVLFPGVVIPITVGRDKSIQLVKDAYATKEKIIGVVAQKNIRIENPEIKDLYKLGTVAQILKLIRMPDGSITIVIQGRNRFRIDDYVQQEPYFRARITKIKKDKVSDRESAALMRTLKDQAYQIIELSPNIPTEAKVALQNINSPNFLLDFIASNLNLEVKEKQRILSITSLLEKGEAVLEKLTRELSVLELSEEIHSKVRTDLDQQQREFFLRQQMKAIQDELGDDEASDMEGFKQRAKEKGWPKAVQKVFDKELNKLSRLSPNMPDHAIVVNYLEWLLDLPWNSFSEDQFDFAKVQKVLDADHYGLEKVKERILEYLAVLKLKSDKKSPILCFYGPPGVGKTSLGKSIATALGREFARISLGGVRDEAEIRGHRRTYIGAMPGRIIQGLKKVNTSNPVFMLDEIDKVGNDFRGDPSSALLEVLDPEQNNTFADHFLEVDYDLSKVMFICTANNLGSIHPALRDRMELIEINGYSLEEKIEIAKRHLIPDLRKAHGLKKSNLKIKDDALKGIIDGYTRESGVRKLAQQVSALCRTAASKIVLEDRKSVTASAKNLEELLGVARFENDKYQVAETPGVAIGLAWTSVGGDILFIETTMYRGSGKLTMTGQLGDVMKESATLAYKYLRANSYKFDIPYEVFNYWDIHLHFPAGAVPKDGPSAGIAILTAMASTFTQRLATGHMAMTGEITLRGKVLPVGGIKEKLLAAIRAGIKTVILCEENAKDIKEIKPEYLEGLTIHYVDRMEDVLGYTLQKEKIAKPIDLMEPVRLAERKNKGNGDMKIVQN